MEKINAAGLPFIVDFLNDAGGRGYGLANDTIFMNEHALNLFHVSCAVQDPGADNAEKRLERVPQKQSITALICNDQLHYMSRSRIYWNLS